ncbi:unnamed protein product [Linum tenue]|uniref:Uncharacterized protein n=2 Tax=Linum tenue TaxID=586396 RepID=A0AAV0Q193_9ROSI|nr:unnamed protein product [Linum tenue]
METESDEQLDYLRWLDLQPARSVLYVSMGSYLSFPATQVEEIAAGLSQSGVRFLWVARGEATRLQKAWGGDRGLMVPWCEQLKVLHHPSVGGFWTHCGWNSVQECVLYAGVPMLTWPLGIDQLHSSKVIVEDWRIGWKVKEEAWMGRERVAGIVKKFMDCENAEVKEIVQFRTIANVIPPERLKAGDFPGFYEAVMTEMESPFEQLLDQLQPPATATIGDIEVRWAMGVGNRRNIPVAAFWTMSASFFSIYVRLPLQFSCAIFVIFCFSFFTIIIFL